MRIRIPPVFRPERLLFADKLTGKADGEALNGSTELHGVFENRSYKLLNVESIAKSKHDLIGQIQTRFKLSEPQTSTR